MTPILFCIMHKWGSIIPSLPTAVPQFHPNNKLLVISPLPKRSGNLDSDSLGRLKAGSISQPTQVRRWCPNEARHGCTQYHRLSLSLCVNEIKNRLLFRYFRSSVDLKKILGLTYLLKWNSCLCHLTTNVINLLVKTFWLDQFKLRM